MAEIQNKNKPNFLSQYWWVILIVIGAGIFLYFFFVKAKNAAETSTTTETPQNHTSGDSNQQNIGIDAQKLSTLAPDKKEAFLLMNDLMGDLKTLQTNYANDLNSIGWGKILDVERIKDDKGFLKSNALLAEANRIIENYRVKYDAILDGMNSKFQASKMSDHAKQSFLEGFQTSIAGQGKDSLWLLESQIVSSMKELFAFLKQKEGKWSIEDGSITLKNNTDQQHFQDYVVRIQTIGIKEEERRKYLSAIAVDEVNKLK